MEKLNYLQSAGNHQKAAWRGVNSLRVNESLHSAILSIPQLIDLVGLIANIPLLTQNHHFLHA
jgi:hypothetical protein